MTDALPDFERQNAVNHWRNTLDNIDRMLRELPEQHVTITSYAMDLAGPASCTEPPLPGGDVLDILGPWSSNATFGDDPTPRQVIVEWAQTVYDAHGQVPPAGLRYTQALVYVREQVPWILESPWVEAWTTDVAAVRGRLAALCPPEVDEHHDDTPVGTPITEDMLWKALEERPDYELTRRDLSHLGISSSTLTTWRHRGKIAETSAGRYRAGDIIELRRAS